MTDISREAVEVACAELDDEAKALGYSAGHKYAGIMRAQAERIAELEAELGNRVFSGKMIDSLLEENAVLKTEKHADAEAIASARNDALREAAGIADAATQHHALCDHYCHDDCPTWTDVPSAILALIKGATND